MIPIECFSGSHHQRVTSPSEETDSTGCKRCFLAVIRALIFVSATSALLYLQIWWATESLGPPVGRAHEGCQFGRSDVLCLQRIRAIKPLV